MLYNRGEARVDAMMRDGLCEEARFVYDNRDRFPTASQAIGYKELFPYFAGQAPLEDCVAALKTATRRYAKRQLTWLRRMEGAAWHDITGRAPLETAREVIADFTAIYPGFAPRI